MAAARLARHRLERENEAFRGSGGVSQENQCLGFRPAFHDYRTSRTYPCCFADGRPSPCHMLDNLPDELVLERDLLGRVLMLRQSVVSGFVREGKFYTREEAAKLATAIPA